MLQNINVKFFSPPYYFYYLFTFCIYAFARCNLYYADYCLFLLVVSYPTYFFLNIFYHTFPVHFSLKRRPKLKKKKKEETTFNIIDKLKVQESYTLRET